jgi:phage tail tape-measure protein
MPKRPTSDTHEDAEHRHRVHGAAAHPVGVGASAAGAGVAGAALGAAVAGPVGAVVGAAVGAVAGGLGGKAAADVVDPDEVDDAASSAALPLRSSES